MTIYRMATAAGDQPDAELIYATHPAQGDTFIIYAQQDGTTHKTVVVLWGVLEDGTAVPITLSGVWDGVSNRNNFVLHPDGHCSAYEESWNTIEEAVETVRLRADD
jgi:hypothetical protein